MREILFKAKRLDNGEWVEGYYLKKVDPLLGTEKCFILNQGDMQSLCGWYPVNAETVCQYTGLTDKNGVKIFEGDRCVFCADVDPGSYEEELEETYTVFWDEEDGRWSVKELEHGVTDSLDRFFAERCTVTGNIHDNA